jgi:hypothetical protein
MCSSPGASSDHSPKIWRASTRVASAGFSIQFLPCGRGEATISKLPLSATSSCSKVRNDAARPPLPAT